MLTNRNARMARLPTVANQQAQANAADCQRFCVR
jgi:hypothetical protein